MARDLVTLQWDDRDLRRGLREMRKEGGDLRPVFKALRKPFRTDLKQRAKAKKGDQGAWPPRAQATRERDRHAKTQRSGRKGVRRFKRRRKTRVLGKLPSAVSVKGERLRFSGESKVPWSLAHQEGAVVGRGSVLPARPFLYFSGPFLETTDEAIVRHLIEKGWRR